MTNESHDNPVEHQYVVTLDDVMACTCPHHVYRTAYCKHMAEVETATDKGTLEAFPLEDNDDERISDPYTGYDKYGNADLRYWRCEECGREATDKRALGGVFGDCC